MEAHLRIFGCPTPDPSDMKEGAIISISFSHREPVASFAIEAGLALPMAVDQLADKVSCAERLSNVQVRFSLFLR